jgi:splicing factor U2AF subunit
METEENRKLDIQKPKNDEDLAKDKSRERDRDEVKKSKKHKKRRDSSSSGSSDDSRSRSRSSRRQKKHKSKRSRSRSPKRSKKRSSERRKRSYSREKKHHRSSHRSRSRDRRDRDRDRRDTRGGDRKRSDSRDKKKNEKSTKSFKDQRGGGGGGFKFDSPPKDMQVSESTIDLSELGIPDIQTLREKYPTLKDMDSSELVQKLLMIKDMTNSQSAKVDRKLYIGNIPTGITPQMLTDLLNSALQKMGVNVDPPGNSIIGAWISPDNNYAFVDFRTPEEATNGFALNSVAIHGQTLKVGRPRSYQQTQTVQNPLAMLLGNPGASVNPLAGLGQTEAPPIETTARIFPPSRILVLKNMVLVQELEIDEEYDEIKEDVKEECEKFGKVESMKIPRPVKGKTDIPGLGKIFMEYSSIDEAKNARKELHGRIFADNTVEVSYYDEALYANNDFTEAQ